MHFAFQNLTSKMITGNMVKKFSHRSTVHKFVVVKQVFSEECVMCARRSDVSGISGIFEFI